MLQISVGCIGWLGSSLRASRCTLLGARQDSAASYPSSGEDGHHPNRGSISQPDA
jgi:hypothetical protein